MVDPLTYVANLLKVTAPTGFALAAAGATVLTLRSNRIVEADSTDMWICYVTAFGFWLFVTRCAMRAYRHYVTSSQSKPDYQLMKTRAYFEIGEASHLLADIKPTMPGTHASEAWYASIREAIGINNIEWNDRRLGPRTGWPHNADRISRQNLAAAVRHTGKRVPRWLRGPAQKL